ncbi:MAG: putative salt-induced outer membrane protein [Oceanicoccus sp.]|jgi:putative salt-induced outer membrane protein
MSFSKTLISIALVSTAHASWAVEPTTGEIELGIVSTTGNTETNSIKSKLSVTQDFESWNNNYLVDTLFKEEKTDNDDGSKTTKTSAERYFASAQGDYKLNEEHSALFVYGSYENDRFTGYKQQNSVAAGYADQVFSNESSSLKYNAGPGYFYNELNDGDTEEGGIIRLALDYRLKLSETSKFKQTLSTEAAIESDDNTKSKSETSVSATLMGNLSLKASYNIIHNTQVPDNKEKMDTTTSISILYLF